MPNIIRRSVAITRSEDGELVITTPNFDRGNDRVFPLGGKLDNYLKNPVVMWLHDYRGMTEAGGIPVAKCPYLKATEAGIVSGPPEFLEGDAFAQRVKNAWEKGFIKTASIGFQPIKSQENERGGFDYLEWEMLEYSLVPIPMNAEAMRVAKAAGLDDLLLTKRSQGEIGDELDYTLAIVREWDLNESNQHLARQIHEEISKRIPAGDTAADIALSELGAAFDAAANKLKGE